MFFKKLVGLHGPSGSGKDTVASLAQEWGKRNGVKIESAAFGDAIKISLGRAFFPHTSEESALKLMDKMVHDNSQVTLSLENDRVQILTGRQFLVNYGRKAVAGLPGLSDIWIDLLLPPQIDLPIGSGSNIGWFKSFNAEVDLLIVTDVRMPAECFRVKELGGEIVRVVRDVERILGQETEVAFADEAIDYSLDNTRGLSELEEGTHKLMEAICRT